MRNSRYLFFKSKRKRDLQAYNPRESKRHTLLSSKVETQKGPRIDKSRARSYNSIIKFSRKMKVPIIRNTLYPGTSEIRVA